MDPTSATLADDLSLEVSRLLARLPVAGLEPDALVAGLVPRYREPGFGLARLTLLVPSSRAARTLSEAFIWASSTFSLASRTLILAGFDRE